MTALAILNETPQPFVWTKTADDILASLARFRKRISDSGHQPQGIITGARIKQRKS